jgi:hypothetical protein
MSVKSGFLPVQQSEEAMNAMLNTMSLERENRRFWGSGGRSEENRGLGFLPAFMDAVTHMIYRSCFADGRPAPFHLLDGLPNEMVLARAPSGRVAAIRGTVVAGFVREGRFYTREEARRCIAAGLQ